jgi:hypothetical protein
MYSSYHFVIPSVLPEFCGSSFGLLPLNSSTLLGSFKLINAQIRDSKICQAGDS